MGGSRCSLFIRLSGLPLEPRCSDNRGSHCMYCVRCVYLSFFDLQGLISTCPRSETKRGPCTYESGVVGYWRAALRPTALPSSPREFPNHSSSNYCQRIGSIFVSVSNSSRPYLLCVLIPGCQFVLNVCTYTCILNSSPPPTHTHTLRPHTHYTIPHPHRATNGPGTQPYPANGEG